MPKDVGGGVSDQNLVPYVAAGIRAFGLGSSLCRERALASVSAYDHAVTKASG